MSKTVSNDDRRLDRIEANLETVSETLVRVARVVEGNREDIDQIFERLDQLSGSVGELRQSQRSTQEAINQLTQSQRSTQEAVNQLTQSQAVTRETLDDLIQLMTQFAQNAEADRQAFQAESRRIWEYLLSQHPNGNAG